MMNSSCSLDLNITCRESLVVETNIEGRWPNNWKVLGKYLGSFRFVPRRLGRHREREGEAAGRVCIFHHNFHVIPRPQQQRKDDARMTDRLMDLVHLWIYGHS